MSATMEDLDMIKQIFKNGDTNGDGTIDLEEMKRILKDVIGDFSDEEAQELFTTIDKDGNGVLYYDEFLAWLWSGVKPKKTPQKKKKASAACLGVVRLDYDYPPAPGDIDCPDSFGYDVFYRVVPGLTFEICQSGVLTEEVEKEFIEAVQWLASKGVSGITGDCGFMMYFQGLARKYTSLPVFMSSLAILPAVTCGYSTGEYIGILTANGATLGPMHDLIKDECGVDTDEDRYVMIGCEDVDGFEAVALGEKVDVEKVTPGIVKKAKQALENMPEIKAFVFECTELPPYSDAVRAATGLPVWDSITCCDFFISGRLDNARFGINDWQEAWDGVQEDYKFGQHLDKEDREKTVNQKSLAALEEAEKAGYKARLTTQAIAS